MKARRFRNWSGAVTAAPRHYERPHDVDALRELVRATARRGGTLRVVGAGHSFTPLVACDDVIVSLERLSGVDAVDPATQEVWVHAGTRLADVSAGLAAQGYALENLGDIDVQCLGGAVSTGTHGTGASLGNLSSQTTALELLTADGELRVLTPQTDPELFRAAQVSLGALGVLTRIRVRALPAYRLRCVKRRADLEATLSSLESLRRSHRHFELFWFPYSEQVLAKSLDLTDEPAHSGGLGAWLDEIALENAAFWTVNQLARFVPAWSPFVSRFSAAVAGGGRPKVNESGQVFATPRLVRFHEMEYALPIDRGAECLREVRDWVRRKRIAVSFPVELRFVRGDEAWLSPSYRRDSAYVAVHMFQKMPYRELFEGAEAIFRNHQGRPHWGKMHSRTERELSELYPRFRDFQRVRAELDPGGVFLSPYLRKLFVPEAEKGDRLLFTARELLPLQRADREK